jgi:hypothetical protein
VRMYEYSEVYTEAWVAELYSTLVALQEGNTNVSTTSLAKVDTVLPNRSTGGMWKCTHVRLMYQIKSYSLIIMSPAV